MWRPYAEPRSRRDGRGNGDSYPRRDAERSYSHTYANHCRQGSCTNGGHAHGHADGYSDGGADQSANTGAHSHSNRYSDVGAVQTANTGAHSHADGYSNSGADQTANTGASSHSNRYSNGGADQTTNTGTHSHTNGFISSPRLHERSLAGTTRPSVGFRDQEPRLGARWYRR